MSDTANFVFDLLQSFVACWRIIVRHHGFMVCLKTRLFAER